MIQATSPETRGDRGPSLAALMAGILDDARRLVRLEIELFKTEIRGELIKLATALGFLAVAAGCALIGCLLTCFMLVYLLHEVALLDLWLSFLIVGGAFLLVGLTLILIAVQRLRSFRFVPEQSLIALKENLQWETNLN